MRITDLTSLLNDAEVPEKAYRINAGLPDADEAYCIERNGNVWQVYYAERGQMGGLVEFDSEAAACDHFLSLLRKDSLLWR